MTTDAQCPSTCRTLFEVGHEKYKLSKMAAASDAHGVDDVKVVQQRRHLALNERLVRAIAKVRSARRAKLRDYHRNADE